MILNHIQVCNSYDGNSIGSEKEPDNPELFNNEPNDFKNLFEVHQTENPLLYSGSPNIYEDSFLNALDFSIGNEVPIIPAYPTAPKMQEKEINHEESSREVPEMKTTKKRKEAKEVFQRKSKFTEKEDLQLKFLFEKYGNNWTLISQFIPGKSRKQVRERHENFLSKTINRKKYTPEEDKKLLRLVKEKGHRFIEIAEQFEGRTPVMIKNRYYSFLKKKKVDDN